MCEHIFAEIKVYVEVHTVPVVILDPNPHQMESLDLDPDIKLI